MQSAITIEGLKEFYASLKQLDVNTRGSILRRVNRKAINIAKRNLVQKIISRGYKNAVKPEHVTVKNDKYNYSGVLAGLTQEAFVGTNFIEQGTKERYAIKRNKKPLTKQAYRGRMKAQPFIIPAHNESESAIGQFIETEYGKQIYKSIKVQTRLTRRRLG